ncbi:MAG: ATP-binding protein [Rubrivivax sp.]
MALFAVGGLAAFGALLSLAAAATGHALLAAGAALALTALVLGALGWRQADARRRRDDASAQRERELALLVRSVQELLFRTDAEGVLGFVNARWTVATGRPESELLGRPLAALVAPAGREAARALFSAGDAGTRSAQLQLEGGAARLFDVTVTPLREQGRIVGFAGSAVDVTDRLAAQGRLRAELAFSSQLLETLPVPVSLIDAEGRYVTVNRAWEAFTGRPREQVAGQVPARFLPPEEAALHESHDRALVAGGGQRHYECGFTHRDGQRRQLAITTAAVPAADGRPAAVLTVLVDISERSAAERATREARDAAEEASRAKSEFIANISHELRTPLQSIIGFSELGQMRGRQHEKLAAMFGDIHAAGQRMLALVNDLLDVSKIESTVGTFHLERTDLRPLVREVAHELGPLLSAKRLHLALELGDVPLVAKVDPMRFQQVVRNVLANAVKFSPEGSAIDVEGDLTAASQIVLSVRDRGPGIPPKELEKIFEAFVQSSKTKDGSGGTGLGLAICRKIVEAHGGRIGAENAEGGGSRFTLTLPARGFVETVV